MKSSVICAFKTAAGAALGLLYPRICAACGRSIESSGKFRLCRPCFNTIRESMPLSPQSHAGEICFFDNCHSAAMYEGAIRECMHKFKYGGMLSLAEFFADIMADFAKRHMEISRFDCLVPVPLHSVKLRERSFNQAAMLAFALSKKLGIPCIDNNLIRTKYGRPQISLSKSSRTKDVMGAFRVKNPGALNGKSILLIDDVFTTGATVNECSSALKGSGAKYVEVFTLAKGEQAKQEGYAHT